MRIDKLTTKFQEALGEAQSLALGNDHAYIEPAHVLVAMLRHLDARYTALLAGGGVAPAGSGAALDEHAPAHAGDQLGRQPPVIPEASAGNSLKAV